MREERLRWVALLAWAGADPYMTTTEWYFQALEASDGFFIYRESGILARHQRLYLTRMEDIFGMAKLSHSERLQVDWNQEAAVPTGAKSGDIMASTMIPSLARGRSNS